MQTLHNVPTLDSSIVCIVDRENVAVAAVASSYFSAVATYVPMFTFPGVQAISRSGYIRSDDDFVPQMVGNEAAVLIRNAIAELGECNTVVLAGLSAAQRSYLENICDARIIEIERVEDLESAFLSLGISRAGMLKCRFDEVLRGLYLAKLRGCSLWVEDDAEPLPSDVEAEGGLVVIEQTLSNAGCVIAVNYACAIGAAIRVVSPLPRHAESGCISLLQRWQDEGVKNSP